MFFGRERVTHNMPQNLVTLKKSFWSQRFWGTPVFIEAKRRNGMNPNQRVLASRVFALAVRKQRSTLESP